MANRVCPQCETINWDNARYCTECGLPLPAVGDTVVVTGAAHPAAETPIATQPMPSNAGHSSGMVFNGRYRLEYELGRGGFGAVYKVTDMETGLPCALKENIHSSSDSQRRFELEAEVLAQLKHPNLPGVTDHFIIPGEGQYLVMDFVDGATLDELIERQPIEKSQTLTWMVEIAAAVEYLHDRPAPILHRDIKPANIRITPEGRPFLVDFGLVKVINTPVSFTVGALAKSPGYAPPEQYGLGKMDVRTDLYALTATLYHLLTGQRPTESVQRGVDDSLLIQNLISLSPPSLARLIAKGLTLEPEARFQTAQELRLALEAVQAELSGRTAPGPTAGAIPPAWMVAPAELPPETNAMLKSIHPDSQPLQTLRADSLPPAGQRPNPQPLQTMRADSQPLAGQRSNQQPLQTMRADSQPLAGQRPSSGPLTARAPDSQPLPGAAKPKRSWLAMGGLLTVALLLGGGLLAVLWSSQNATQSANATRQAQQQALSLNLQATSNAQAAGIQATQTQRAGGGINATALLPELPAWPLRVADGFAVSSSEWWQGERLDTPNFERLSAELDAGVQRVTLAPKVAGVSWFNRHSALRTGEQFVLTATSRQLSGPPDACRGLTFRHVDDRNYYLFLICDSGQFFVQRLVDGALQAVIAPTETTGIRPNGDNQIIIWGQGSQFTFFINQLAVADIALNEFTNGQGSLYYSAASVGEIEFETRTVQLYTP